MEEIKELKRDRDRKEETKKKDGSYKQCFTYVSRRERLEIQIYIKF
jgi:hypothetical protein